MKCDAFVAVIDSSRQNVSSQWTLMDHFVSSIIVVLLLLFFPSSLLNGSAPDDKLVPQTKAIILIGWYGYTRCICGGHCADTMNARWI
jgi:hypothetical protein